MLIKTHMAAGLASASTIATALILTGATIQPLEYIVDLATAVIASVMPDIDQKHAYARKIIPVVITVMWAAWWLIPYLLGVECRPKRLAGMGCLTVLYLIGILTPHRTLTHSIVAAAIAAWCVHAIYAPVMPFALAGYLSHLVLDALNRMGEMLLFPFPRRMCLYLCSSNGLVNTLLGIAGVAISTIMTGMYIATVVIR